MTVLFQTTSENRTLEIQETPQGPTPLQITITVRKLGVTTSIYYQLRQDEAHAVAMALSKRQE